MSRTLILLNPKINRQILQADLHTFPLRISWENLIKDQGIFSLVIILYILTTVSLDNVWISLGENCCWSLLLKLFLSAFTDTKCSSRVMKKISNKFHQGALTITYLSDFCRHSRKTWKIGPIFSSFNWSMSFLAIRSNRRQETVLILKQ